LCNRCPVPTRNPFTGETNADFMKDFVHFRQGQIPAEAEKKQYEHYYKLTVNTRIDKDQAGKILKTGDSLKIK
jgi:uncharacterized protein